MVTESEFEEMQRRVAKNKAQALNPRDRGQEGHAIDTENPKSQTKLRKKRNTPEADMQVALFEIIRLNETKWPLLQWVYHVPSGELRHPVVAKRLKAQGVRPGVWDITVDVPKWTRLGSAYGGGETITYSGLRIEMKVPGKKLTPAQIDWGAHYKSHGFDTEVCFSWVQAWNRIVIYLDYEELRMKE